jgi:peptide/nickel transport system substrate-binding protein
MKIIQRLVDRMARAAAAAFLLAGAGLSLPVHAEDLRIGFKAEITSADPHVLNGQSRNLWMHVYEGLVGQDDKLRAVPQLATSWRAVDDTTWEFKLRSNVTFHNGAPLTAEDVKFSIERARDKTGPRTFRSYLRTVDSVQASDPATVLVKTKGIDPALPDNIGLIAVLPKSIGKDASEESFESGQSAIGSGPYRYVEWQRGQRVTLAAHDKYWGAREPWGKVTFQFIPKEAARASALLAGSVDLIDGASAGLADAFQRNEKVELSSTTSYMLNYLHLDRRASAPFVSGNDGQPLAQNPLNDARVRRAMALAINRDAINRFVMKGDAEPTAQFVPAGYFGHDPALKAPAADAARAKALLAEAGYPQGFRLALHCSNDRYLNDARVCEAIGQMYTQIGIKTEVKTLPFAVFQTRSLTGGANGEPEFSVGMYGVGSVTGDSLQAMLSTVASVNKAAGTGVNNRGLYQNPELDALLIKASRTMDPKAREELQRAAARLAFEDGAIIPIHFLKAAWAVRKGLELTPRSDGFTLAMLIRPRGVK